MLIKSHAQSINCYEIRFSMFIRMASSTKMFLNLTANLFWPKNLHTSTMLAEVKQKSSGKKNLLHN